MPTAEPDQDAQNVLGQYLAALRQSKNLTLRDVEAKSEKAISNAYLSQIETGKVKKLSPHVLHTLSEIYHTSYTSLMERAGYVTVDQGKRRAATYAVEDLSEAEHQALMVYLQVMRKQARKRA